MRDLLSYISIKLCEVLPLDFTFHESDGFCTLPHERCFYCREYMKNIRSQNEEVKNDVKRNVRNEEDSLSESKKFYFCNKKTYTSKNFNGVFDDVPEEVFDNAIVRV